MKYIAINLRRNYSSHSGCVFYLWSHYRNVTNSCGLPTLNFHWPVIRTQLSSKVWLPNRIQKSKCAQFPHCARFDFWMCVRWSTTPSTQGVCLITTLTNARCSFRHLVTIWQAKYFSILNNNKCYDLIIISNCIKPTLKNFIWERLDPSHKWKT